jgi:hypothetical protein
MGSPGAGKPHTGQYGESTPSRQRGGAGPACPLPTDSALVREREGDVTMQRIADTRSDTLGTTPSSSRGTLQGGTTNTQMTPWRN